MKLGYDELDFFTRHFPSTSRMSTLNLFFNNQKTRMAVEYELSKRGRDPKNALNVDYYLHLQTKLLLSGMVCLDSNPKSVKLHYTHLHPFAFPFIGDEIWKWYASAEVKRGKNVPSFEIGLLGSTP